MERINKIVFLVILFNCWAYQLLACSCAPKLLEKEIEQTPIIFTGKVIQVEPFKISSNGFEKEYHRTTFEVMESLKGESGNRISIITDSNDGSCGYSFSKDSSYVVFGNYDYYGNQFNDSELRTGLCTRTRMLSKSTGLIRKLKKLGNRITSIESIDANLLYKEIWLGEKFMWTDESPETLLSKEEQLKLFQPNSKYCKPDSTFSQNKSDSLGLDLLDTKPTEIVVFDVDVDGSTSNFDILLSDSTGKRYQELAIQFVKSLNHWKPATIRGIKVKSNGFYEVDFAKCYSQ